VRTHTGHTLISGVYGSGGGGGSGTVGTVTVTDTIGVVTVTGVCGIAGGSGTGATTPPMVPAGELAAVELGADKGAGASCPDPEGALSEGRSPVGAPRSSRCLEAAGREWVKAAR
jgi:hypothetical protein